MRCRVPALIAGILCYASSSGASAGTPEAQPTRALALNVQPGALEATYLKVLWTYDHDEPIVDLYYDNGVILLETAGRRLVRLDPTSGLPYDNRLRLREKLSYPPAVYRHSKPASGPKVPDEVFLIQHGDILSCVEADSLIELWSENLGYGVSCAPCVSRDMMFIAAEGGRLSAMGKVGRSVAWTYSAAKTISAPPVLGQTVSSFSSDSGEKGEPADAGAATMQESDFLYAASEDGKVYRLNAYGGWKPPGDRGGYSWHGETKARIVTSPVSYQQRVFAASFDYSLYAFEEVDGARAWKYHVGRLVREQPFACWGTIFVLAEEVEGRPRTLYAVRARDGVCQWKRKETGAAGTPYHEDGLAAVGEFLAPGKELVYVLAENKPEIWGVRIADGKVLHRIGLTQRPHFTVSHDAAHGRQADAMGLILMAAKSGRVLALKERRVYGE